MGFHPLKRRQPKSHSPSDKVEHRTWSSPLKGDGTAHVPAGTASSPGHDARKGEQSCGGGVRARGGIYCSVHSSLPRSACSASRRTCCEGCFMYNSFLGLCLLLQNGGRKARRVLLAPLCSAGRGEMPPCLYFISMHWGDGEGGSSKVKQSVLKSID